MSIAIAADLVLAAESAHFTVAYTAIGFSPDGGSSWTLPRIVGDAPRDRADAAQRAAVAPRARTSSGSSRAWSPTTSSTRRPRRSPRRLARGPVGAHGAVKRLLRETYKTARSRKQLEDEARTIAGLSAAPDGREGVLAFLDKRAPHFGEP